MTPTLENLTLNDKGIAFNPVTGETFRLVGSAVQLVRLLKQGADSAALLHYLLEEYDVDEATAQRDLDAFLATLERMNWVEVAS
jgi:PqqD family protein of HPr-rel-A system